MHPIYTYTAKIIRFLSAFTGGDHVVTNIKITVTITLENFCRQPHLDD